ncbi:MAG: tRNA 2-thiocytidine(32) synthetase TtcA [Bacteroidales bacterium]|nr:tRNA 2-thiocytidine(32) synthetase TtcA [Bacteroidales bacterium]
MAKGIGYKTNLNYLQQFCNSLNIDFVVKEFEIENIESAGKTPCFLCSWHRRKALFDLTRDLGYSKLALGHHMDDALQTMLMNMIYHGSISSLPQKFSMFNDRLLLIRPLLDIPEQDLVDYAVQRKFPDQVKQCPYGEETGRKTMKNALAELEKIYPVAKKNMYRAMDNIYIEYLPKRHKT